MLPERFTSKFTEHPETGCWEWQAAKFRGGYGNYFINDFGMRNIGAHRAALILSGRELQRDDVIDHLCRNPSCVNPDHLDVVDQATNARRGMGWSGMHYRQTHCTNGHAFDEANTYVAPAGANRAGRRACRKCRAEYQARLRASRRTCAHLYADKESAA